MTKFKTTLKRICEFEPCEGEERLAELGLTEPDDREVTLRQVYDKYGLLDAIWCIRAVEGCERESQLFALFCAKQVKHVMTDERSVRAVEVTELYMFGKASKEELKTTIGAAFPAAFAAVGAAARAAARAALAAGTDWAARDAVRAAVEAVLAAVDARAAVRAKIEKAFLDMLDDPSSIERAVLEMNDD